MDSLGNWLRKNASTIIILLAIFGLALFLRAYFPLEQSLQEHLLSGGSDSYYWEHIIRHIVTTGHQLDWDPLLNYPMGLGNPRPPIFSWFIAVPGIVFSPLVGDVWQSVVTVLILSTAIWGALTVFPTYFLTKNIFGRRAGLIAAFLLAVMPAHLQRSQATGADHDSMVLFFVVTSFYFFMKALKTLKERRWVTSWDIRKKDSRQSISYGLKTFFKENPKSILYSVMAGMAMGTVALIWQGWAYAPIILLIYVVLQLFVDRLRDRDPMGMGICFTITMGIAFLIAAPWYILFGQIKVWFDVPLILFLAAMALGAVLTVTRNYPWILVIPSVLIASGVILAILVVMSPAVATAFVSGAGYFVRTKLYETIAEAQPPGISQAILSFGAATYYLSLFGLFWMAVKLPKRLERDFLFILTWSFAAVFMSMAAARFIFNASPAFALTAGWIITIFVDLIDFESMKKTFATLVGGSKLTALRKSVKPRHIIGTFLIVFIILLPNVWYGVDASIPYEQKSKYDSEVYYSIPDFMRPQGYTPQSGGSFYFGAFGYSLPLTNAYFPSSWEWFAEQDTREESIVKRPAYLSWWDYGFEAVDRGDHPTVADNFQNGYQMAGQFITAQSEDTAISLLVLRLIEGDYYGNKGYMSSKIATTLQKFNIDPIKVENVYRNPSSVIKVVLNDPIKYGHWDSRMQSANAVYIYLSSYFDEQTTTGQLASLYHEIREVTGWSIRYFSVDSRMFPFDGGGNNIFYAPVKLSDHRILELPDGRVIPTDFFAVEAETDKGVYDVSAVPLGAQINRLNIKYTDMFYNSMFYRAYLGFGPSHVNQVCNSKDCLPGIRGEINTMMPMQAWNMSHFKVVYKTSYFNPWSFNEYQNHSEDWRAVNYFDALDLQRKISRNEMTGVVDFSNQTLVRSGLVYIKYYDGAYINGTITVDGITPLSGVRVTVQDYEDPTNPTPHHSVLTDENGKYSVLAPFGYIRLVSSIGDLNPRTLTGSTVLDQQFLFIRDDQAMREDVDLDGDGLPDYEIRKDITVRGVTITGYAYLDADGNKNISLTEERVANSVVTFRHKDLGLATSVTTDGDGGYIFPHAYEGQYIASSTFRGRTFILGEISVGKTDSREDIPVATYILEGAVSLPGGFAVAGANVVAFDEAWDTSVIINTNEVGEYRFDLLPGNFMVSAAYGFNASIPTPVYVGGPLDAKVNITLTPSGQIAGKTSVGGLVQGNVLMDFLKKGVPSVSMSTTSDATGSFKVQLPTGVYEVTSKHYRNSNLFAYMGRATVIEGVTTNLDLSLSEGVKIEGVAYSINKTRGAIGLLNITFSDGQATHTVRTSTFGGRYVAFLRKGDYVVQAGYFNLSYLKNERFLNSQTYDINLQEGTSIRATIFYDRDRSGIPEPTEGIENVRVTFTDSLNRQVEAFTDSDGRYELTVPAGGIYTMRASHPFFQTFLIGPASLQNLGSKFTTSLLPINVTTSGQLTVLNSVQVTKLVQIHFVGAGAGAISTSTTTDSLGRYSVDIAPGNYEIHLDQAVTNGQEDIRYQNANDEILILKLGATNVKKDLDVFIRTNVSGSVRLFDQLRDATVVFQGPESVELIAENGSFSLMLAQGGYTLYSNYTLDGTVYSAFMRFTFIDPASIVVDLVRATTVQGALKFEDARLSDIAPVTFISDQGAVFERVTDSEGSYTTYLVPGNYSITVSYKSNTTIDYITRYVVYSHSSTLPISKGQIFITHDLDLERKLDNSTLRGRLQYNGLPSPAKLEFRPISPDGINATTTASADGTYYIELTPGPYSMYIHDPSTHGVSLQGVDITPRSSTYMNLSLEKGYKVSGVTTYLSNIRIPSRFVYSDSTVWEVYTDNAGYYEAYLPARQYSLNIGTILQEHGLNVGYNASSSLNLEADTVRNYHLSRVPRHGVYLSYDRSQVKTVPTGGSIQYSIKVWNDGSKPDTYKLTGATVGWDITFDRDVVSVDFGSINGVPVNTTFVTATIKVPVDATIDHAPVSITATSFNATSTRYTLRVDVDVMRTSGIILRKATTLPAYDGRFLNYTLEIANTGNGAERVGILITNAPEVEQLGWDSRVRVNSTSPMDMNVEGIIVGANSTTQVSIVMKDDGGGKGVNLIVKAYLQDNKAYESVLQLPTELPLLQLEGGVAVAGSAIERQAPVNSLLLTVTISLGVVAAFFLVMFLRDRQKRRWR